MDRDNQGTSLGAHPLATGGVHFSVWAPRPKSLALRIVRGPGSGGADRPLQRTQGDVWSATVPEAAAGSEYVFVMDGDRVRPDPRARFLPHGVHGAAEVIDPRHDWRHPVPRVDLEDAVLYELHVGTFTAEGTYAAAIARLPHLVKLGVTAVELLPVSAFPGGRNWGYDGVAFFAPVAAYGRPEELRAFVDAAHGLGLGVLLDVVYNHLGPEGNYLGEMGPYFMADRTLWGDGPDFERPQVRALVTDSVRAWLGEYRFDGLRLDAIHAIVDPSAAGQREHVLGEIVRHARPGVVIAETDMNDVRVFDEWGFDATWSDDFHHALHAQLSGERQGYYATFGAAAQVAATLENGWLRGPHPERSRELPATRFLISTQTHDQVGNRARGERLEHLTSAAAARLAAVALLAAPAVPMLFMGEEWGARSPFLYFTSHGDSDLARAVSEGRKNEFAAFTWQDDAPDPQDEDTFARSKLDWSELDDPLHLGRLALYTDLLALRRRELGARKKTDSHARAEANVVWLDRGELTIVLNLDDRAPAEVPHGYTVLLHSEDTRYGGTLATPARHLPPRSAAIYRRG